MSTRWAVTPPEAALWLLSRHPELLDELERGARDVQNPALAQSLRFAAQELRAAARDFRAGMAAPASARLAEQGSTTESPDSVSNQEAADVLEVGLRMVSKLVAEGRLVRAGRGRIDAVSLSIEVARRAAERDRLSSETA